MQPQKKESNKCLNRNFVNSYTHWYFHTALRPKLVVQIDPRPVIDPNVYKLAVCTISLGTPESANSRHEYFQNGAVADLASL